VVFSLKKSIRVCFPSGGKINLIWVESAVDMFQFSYKFKTCKYQCKVLIVKNINMF
jgi:hypothetical protein